MRRLIMLLGIMGVSCIGCTPYRQDTTLFQTTGRQKAIVTVLPVVDHTSDSQVTWNFSQEFTEEIRKRIHNSTKVYLLREEGTSEIAERLNTSDLKVIAAEMMRYRGAAEYVVVIELIDQTEEPYGLSKSSDNRSHPIKMSSVLSLAMRVRVIDVRSENPRIVLQEVLNQEHVITNPYLNADYVRSPWGTQAFQHTPMGLIHSQMISELVARVESYIDATR